MIENDQLYADACFPKERWNVCGVKLKPFSVGHAIILQSIGSPFLGFESPEFDDLMLALWVCSQDVKPGENTTQKALPWRWRWATRHLHKIADKEPARLWKSILALQEYVFESLWFKPPISTRNNQLCRTSTCPAFIPMKRSLMSSWGYSEREVLNMPLAQAKIEHCAWMEHEGALTFTTQEDLDIVKVAMLPENIAWNKKVREDAARKKAERDKQKS